MKAKAWTGRMRGAYLNDRQIQPTHYPTWKATFRDLENRTRDRRVLEELWTSIEEEGVLEPVLLGVDDRRPRAYVSNGHHRSYVITHQEIAWFPVQWYWITHCPKVWVEHGPFPYDYMGWPQP